MQSETYTCLLGDLGQKLVELVAFLELGLALVRPSDEGVVLTTGVTRSFGCLVLLFNV